MEALLKMYSQFALGLRDVAAEALVSTSAFFTEVEVEDVRLEGDENDPSLVILLRTSDYPNHLFRLRTRVGQYEANDADASGWAGYLHDRIMETVDAAPGLRPGSSGSGITTIDF